MHGIKCSRQERRKVGGRGRNRTYNQSIKSRMLCQLSYASRLETSMKGAGFALNHHLIRIPYHPYPMKSGSAFSGIIPRSYPIVRIRRMASRPSSPKSIVRSFTYMPT